jgi:hypothetical protein
MKLLTKAILKATPPLYAMEAAGDSAPIRAKFFAPWTSWTWYMTEYDPEEGIAFGLVDGHELELGYFSIAELESIKGPFGLGIERDIHWGPHTIGEVKTAREIARLRG